MKHGRTRRPSRSGARTARTANNAWQDGDVLEIHRFDGGNRGIRDGDLVPFASRAGDRTLHARISERMQLGVVYTTFHHSITGANVVTTEFSDWAANCAEYKVTPVEARPAERMFE
jgi:formate dehydrogenase major subunit